MIGKKNFSLNQEIKMNDPLVFRLAAHREETSLWAMCHSFGYL
jgi:hypothetical protein